MAEGFENSKVKPEEMLSDEQRAALQGEKSVQTLSDEDLKNKIQSLFEGKKFPEKPLYSDQRTAEGYAAEFVAAKACISIILDKMRAKIDDHYFTSLIGDDASGRIPAIILQRTLNKIYATRKEKPLDITFLAGGRMVVEREWQEIQNSIANLSDRIGEHPLMLTDRIAGGQTIVRYIEAFKKSGINLEFASLLSSHNNIPQRTQYDWTKSRNVPEEVAGKEILTPGFDHNFYHDENSPGFNTNAFMDYPELAGVKKSGSYPYIGIPKSVNFKKDGEEIELRGFSLPAKRHPETKDIPMLIREAREASELVANALAEEYLAKDQQVNIDQEDGIEKSEIN